MVRSAHVWAVVQPLEKLRKLGARSRRCSFVGYKYEGGGCRVWTRARGLLSSPEMSFSMRDGMPPPTLNESRQQPPTRTSWLYSLH